MCFQTNFQIDKEIQLEELKWKKKIHSSFLFLFKFKRKKNMVSLQLVSIKEVLKDCT